jgi:Flp pilus assembly protein TadB
MTALIVGAVAALAIVLAARPWAIGARPLALPTVARAPRRAVCLGALVVIGAVAPPLALAALLGWWSHGWRRTRRRRTEAAADVRRSLPDTVDLLRLTTTAGLSLALAHPLVALHTPGAVGAALRDAVAASGRGVSRADALIGSLAPLGERARSLAAVLGDHLRYGVPLLPGLDRIGLELRLDRRRAAELEARRVPVRLLGPLVTCVLPAFALLTVVPLLVASLAALPL